jgi:hypothetical protein
VPENPSSVPSRARLIPLAGAIVLSVLIGFAGSHWSSAVGYQADSATPAASPVASPAASEGSDFVYTTGKAAIRITPAGFAPRHVLYAVGIDVTLAVTNATGQPRTFTMDGLGIEVEIQPGETAEVVLERLDLGEYPFHSASPGGDATRFDGRVTVFI